MSPGDLQSITLHTFSAVTLYAYKVKCNPPPLLMYLYNYLFPTTFPHYVRLHLLFLNCCPKPDLIFVATMTGCLAGSWPSSQASSSRPTTSLSSTWTLTHWRYCLSGTKCPKSLLYYLIFTSQSSEERGYWSLCMVSKLILPHLIIFGSFNFCAFKEIVTDRPTNQQTFMRVKFNKKVILPII